MDSHKKKGAKAKQGKSASFTDSGSKVEPVSFAKDSPKPKQENNKSKVNVFDAKSLLVQSQSRSDSPTVDKLVIKTGKNKKSSELDKSSKQNKKHKLESTGETSFKLSLPVQSNSSGNKKQKRNRQFDDQFDNYSSPQMPSDSGCILKRETVTVYEEVPVRDLEPVPNSFSQVSIEEDEESWKCPICFDSSTELVSICCDSCDVWYHMVCVGVLKEPAKNERWFCPPCVSSQQSSRKSSSKKKDKSGSKQQKSLKHSDSVTITPLPSYLGDTTITPVMPPFYHPADDSYDSDDGMTITPSHPGYKTSGRSRGRPRKDSANPPGQQPSLTITPMPPCLDNVPDLTNMNDLNRLAMLMDPQLGANLMAAAASLNLRPNPNPCSKCFTEGMDFQMVICKKCTQYFHKQCVGLSDSHGSSWVCSGCRHMSKKSSKQSSSGKGKQQSLLHPQQQQQMFQPGPSSSKYQSNKNASLSMTDAKFMTMMQSASGSSSSKSKSHQKSSKSSSSIYMQQQQQLLASFGQSSAMGYDDEFDNSMSKMERSMVEEDDEDEGQGQSCAVCLKEDNGCSKWIACDECNQWYHFICVGLEQEPSDDESWFCRKCIKRQAQIANQWKKIKRL